MGGAVVTSGHSPILFTGACSCDLGWARAEPLLQGAWAWGNSYRLTWRKVSPGHRGPGTPSTSDHQSPSRILSAESVPWGSGSLAGCSRVPSGCAQTGPAPTRSWQGSLLHPPPHPAEASLPVSAP